MFFNFLISGGRQAPEIVNWLKKKTGPPCQKLENVEDFKKFQTGNEVVVVGYFEVSEKLKEKLNLQFQLFLWFCKRF